MKQIEVEVFGEGSNSAIIRLPGRRFPGIVIQGDSLAGLADAVARATEALRAGNGEEAADELHDLKVRLDQYQSAYEYAVVEAGIELPYVKGGVERE